MRNWGAFFGSDGEVGMSGTGLAEAHEAAEAWGLSGARDLTWREAYRAVVPLMRVENRLGWLYIAREWLGIALVLAGCTWAYRSWAAGALPLAAFVPIAALGMLAMAALQHRLSGLAHDASHYVLFHDRLANELASDVFLMFPVFGMTQKFRNSHLGHHRYVNHPEMDPDVVRLNAHAPQRFPVSPGRFCLRYLVETLWPPTLLGYLFGQAKGANAKVGGGVQDVPAPYRFRIGRMMRGCFWLTTLTIVHALRVWPIFLIFWVAPLLTFYPLLMQLREIVHHSNAPDDGKFTNSRVIRVNPVLEAAVFPYGQAYHVTHHLFAMLPHHTIAQAHEILMRYPPYRDEVVLSRGFFHRPRRSDAPTVLDALARRPRPGDLLWDGPPHARVPAEVS
jgi:fatty acid desaturase